MKRILFPFAFFVCATLLAQEGTVGIGTYTPNEKAVLHLVARNKNQGFLIPKLTTPERSSFGSTLTEAENGMMVYDSDMNQFYFWIQNQWKTIGSSILAGEGIEINGGTIINTGDTNPNDDFSGEWTDLLNIPSGFLDGTDDVADADNDPTNELELPINALANQVLTYNGSSWGAGYLPADGDTDDANELQDLTLTNNILSISGITGANQINLAPFLGSNTDEQNLTFSGGSISLTGDPDNTIIDLSNYDSNASDDFSGDWGDLANIPTGFQDGTDDVNDADANNTNEIQDLSLSGDDLVITNNTSATTIDLSPYRDNTDLLATLSGLEGQVVKYVGGTWVVAGDAVNDEDNDPNNEIELPGTASMNQVLIYNGSNWVAGTSPSDGDSDNTNELQELQFASQTISLSSDPGSTTINLAPYMDNTDLLATLSGTSGQVLTFNGSTWTADNLPADGDSDNTNELQDLDLNGNILTITGLGVPTQIDLSPYSGTNTDEQNLQFVSEKITLSGDPDNTEIDLSPYMDNTDLLATLSGTSGQVLTYNGSTWVANDLPTDSDTDNTNEIQDLNLTGDDLVITNNGSATTIDLSPYMDNTDLLATLSGTSGQVLTYNGSIWAADDLPTDSDTDNTNEIQDLNLTGDDLVITNNGSATTIDLSPYKDSPFTTGSDGIGTYIEYTNRIKALNVINSVESINDTDLVTGVLTESLYNSAKTVMVDAGVSTVTITNIEAGLNGQEIMIVCTGGTLEFDNSQMNGSNLVLPSAIVSLPAGGSMSLMYVSGLSSWIHLESVTTVVNPN